MKKLSIVVPVGILMATAILKIHSLMTAGDWLHEKSPLLPLSNGMLTRATILLEAGMAVFLMSKSSQIAKHISVLWLTGVFLSYHLLIWTYAPTGSSCGCLGAAGPDSLFLNNILPLFILLVFMICGIFGLRAEWNGSIKKRQ